MSIVLMILKILGILLLCLLGLILAVILIVLLTPVRYQIYGKRERDTGIMTVGGKVSWLLSIFSICFSYDQGWAVSVRIFGHRLKDRKSGGQGNPTSRQEEISIPPEEERTQVIPEPKADETEPPAEVKSLEDAAGERANPSDEMPAASPDPVNRPKPGRQSAQGRAAEAKKQASEKKETISKILDFIQREEVKATLHLLWRQTGRILRHMLPQKIWLQIRFGLSDPARTGQLTALMSLIPFFYQRGIRVTPVFDEACIDGEFAVRGRIRLGTCIRLALRVIFSRSFWKLYKAYQAFEKE